MDYMISEETRLKMSLSAKLRNIKPPSRKGMKSPMEGKKHTIKSLKKMSISQKKARADFPERYIDIPHDGMLGKKMTEEAKQKIRLAQTGRKHTPETKAKLSALWKGKKRTDLSGDKHYNWKGGITSVNEQVRKSLEYKLWRTAVFERDDFTCIWCKKTGGVLHADHIKRFSDYPELRFAIDNGRTLCEQCHRTTETYGNRKQ